jgi:DNA repair exonuclease SbcCD ATPase subunit
MTPKPAGNTDPLECSLPQSVSSRGALFRPAPEEKEAGASGARAPWLGGETGAVLERQLLLVNAEEAFPSRGWRWLRVSLLAVALVALVAGGIFAIWRQENKWSREIGNLEGRIGNLEKQAADEKQAQARAQEETRLELAERRKENQKLFALVEETGRRLQTTREEVSRLQGEKERLEQENRELKNRPGLRLSEFLSQLCPVWLRELGAQK